MSIFVRRGSQKITQVTAEEHIPPPVSAKSIAVLPFENLSADQANAFFADGVQDEILTDLAKIADLKVISRTSVMQYKTAAKHNLREIAQQLGVAHVVEGSVQRTTNRVRVSVQLIDARTDTHLWAEHYDRPLDDVFAIQTEIAPPRRRSARSWQPKKRPSNSNQQAILLLTIATFALRYSLRSALTPVREDISTRPRDCWNKRSLVIPHSC